ncbi:MAG: DUF4422 domain-containing protein [Gordonibacter sp.]|nr:DUF4422 domain-containing protein [Gordonibacter sp.]
MSDIKIFIACHKDDIDIPDNELFFPIQVGSACSDVRFEGMFHDDEGESISEKNPYYCELTAQYWAWKNIEADYYGFFHYRRYLSFSEKKFSTNLFADASFDANDKETLASIGLEESRMREIIEQYDFVLPERGRFSNDLTMREQYDIAIQHRSEDLDCVLDIISERYPHMLDAANHYLDSTSGYFCNMFIMKKDLFYSYCEWLFAILAEHEQRRDFSMYDPASFRVSGYLAERLCGIYFTWLKDQGVYRYCELQRPFFANTSKPNLPSPVFQSEHGLEPIVLVLSANDYYVPYLGVLLQSIKETSSTGRNYDIVVLHRDITDRSQKVLLRSIAQANISLRFFDTTRFMVRYEDDLFLRGHFRIETYFRLLMQDILPDYDKALYLDADMVVTRDIADLYDENIDGYLLAAVKDADTAGLYNGFEPQKKAYMDTVLKIKKPYEYFQAGTILFNLAEFRRTYTVKEMFDFAVSYEWELLDQDVLNYFAQGRTKFLDMSWNVVMDWRDIRIKEIIGRAPRPLYLEYMEARKHPAVVHFAGPDKPWSVFDSDMADYFWDYASRTVFMPIIVDREITSRIPAPALTLKERVWHILYPLYDKLFPRESNRREKVYVLYQKLRGRA